MRAVGAPLAAREAKVMNDSIDALRWKIEHNKEMGEIRQIVERIDEKLKADKRRHEPTILTDLEAVKRLYFCKGVAVAIAAGTTVFLVIQIVYRLF